MTSEWKTSLCRVGAVAFKTMAALCVEVEPVLWERGRPHLCNVVLMTSIHGQCQVQVEMEDGGGLGIPPPLTTKPGSLIQSTTAFWAN